MRKFSVHYLFVINFEGKKRLVFLFMTSILFTRMHAVSTQERLILKKYYFEPYFCGYYTREVNKQERLMMARVRYLVGDLIDLISNCTKTTIN